MAGPQGLLHRFVKQPLSLKPTAGTQVQTRLRFIGLAAAQQVGEQVMVSIPVAMLVQRHQKHLVRLQVTKDGRAVVALTQGIA